MPGNDFNLQLSETISALCSTSFTTKLIRLINSVLSFDCAVIVGHQEGKHPVYLYDSIKNNRDLLFHRYLITSFQDDPFYRKLNASKQQGIYVLRDVIKKDLNYQAYCEQFYHQTGWKDELSILVEVESERWVMLYFGSTQKDNRFTTQQIDALKPYFAIIQSLCQQHWKKPAKFVMAESVLNSGVFSNNIREHIQYALASFGEAILTKREQEITSLIAQGYDTREIAKQLDITEGTVKNHRKRIYAQLNVTSLSELFQLFLNHVIMQSR